MHMCSAYDIAEAHQFPRNSVIEFSEYLQWDRITFKFNSIIFTFDGGGNVLRFVCILFVFLAVNKINKITQKMQTDFHEAS